MKAVPQQQDTLMEMIKVQEITSRGMDQGGSDHVGPIMREISK
jgi:hypothetical protein